MHGEMGAYMKLGIVAQSSVIQIRQEGRHMLDVIWQTVTVVV